MTTAQDPDIDARLDTLTRFRDFLVEALPDVHDALSGPEFADVRAEAFPWLRCLDRATGAERRCTVEGTIERLRTIRALAAGA